MKQRVKSNFFHLAQARQNVFIFKITSIAKTIICRIAHRHGTDDNTLRIPG